MVTIALHGVAARIGGRQVLDGIEARLEPGGITGIIGPNGAGKSSLLRTILGLVPLAAGRIEVDGAAVATLARTDLARRLAYLPQGQTIHWPLTVERLVALGRLPHLAPLSRMAPDDVEAIEAALRRADILHLRHRVATELSGGERARAMLARMLAVQAPGLLVDEPLAALDPGHQIDVMDLLRREANAGALVVAVLHDLTIAGRYCDRLLMMNDGRLVADGAPEAVLTQDRVGDVYGIRIDRAADARGLTVVPLGRR